MSLKVEANTDVAAIHAPVGGGHLTYLYSLSCHLEERGLKVQILDPLLDSNTFTQAVWTGFKTVYEFGGRGSWQKALYEFSRRNSDKGSLLLNLARLELIEALSNFSGKIVSDHAYVSPNKGFLIQSDVRAEKHYADKKSIVFVPVDEAVNQLLEFGHPQELIRQVGFFVPKSITDQQLKQRRLDNFKYGFARIGFFGTGASIAEHYKYLQHYLLPALAPLLSGWRTKLTIYTWTNAKRGMEIERQAKQLNLTTTINNDDADWGNWQVRVMWGETPYDAVMRSVAVADQIDYMVTMLGERVGWLATIPGAALPPVNFNARNNTAWAIQHGYIRDLSSNGDLAKFIEGELRYGGLNIQEQLKKTAEIPIHGAQKAAGIIFAGK